MVNDTELRENAIYIVKQGKLELVEKPKTGFGKTIIHWQDGHPITQEIRYTKKINN